MDRSFPPDDPVPDREDDRTPALPPRRLRWLAGSPNEAKGSEPEGLDLGDPHSEETALGTSAPNARRANGHGTNGHGANGYGTNGHGANGHGSADPSLPAGGASALPGLPTDLRAIPPGGPAGLRPGPVCRVCPLRPTCRAICDLIEALLPSMERGRVDAEDLPRLHAGIRMRRALLDGSHILTPHQQEVVRLYYRESLQQGEIAERLGVSQQAVHDSLRRARHAIGEQILHGGRGPRPGTRLDS